MSWPTSLTLQWISHDGAPSVILCVTFGFKKEFVSRRMKIHLDRDFEKYKDVIQTVEFDFSHKDLIDNFDWYFVSIKDLLSYALNLSSTHEGPNTFPFITIGRHQYILNVTSVQQNDDNLLTWIKKAICSAETDRIWLNHTSNNRCDKSCSHFWLTSTLSWYLARYKIRSITFKTCVIVSDRVK